MGWAVPITTAHRKHLSPWWQFISIKFNLSWGVTLPTWVTFGFENKSVWCVMGGPRWDPSPGCTHSIYVCHWYFNKIYTSWSSRKWWRCKPRWFPADPPNSLGRDGSPGKARRCLLFVTAMGLVQLFEEEWEMLFKKKIFERSIIKCNV